MCFRVRYGKKENGTLPAHEKILDFKNLVLIVYSQDSSACLLFLTLSTEFWFHILLYIKSQMNIPKIWCIPENEIKKCFKIYIYKIQKYLQVVTWQQKTQTKNNYGMEYLVITLKLNLSIGSVVVKCKKNLHFEV